jgi:magnesium chelatase family protein
MITGAERINPLEATGEVAKDCPSNAPDFADIRGQELVKRAAQVAAAGMHGMLMIGPPGVGKSMVGKRIPGIMPPLSYQEQLDVTQIYSVAGLLTEKMPMITNRPFRAPHHSVSAVSLVGGGRNPKPGEISLAHNGVLFLDELPEFASHTLDTLRQPLDDGEVSITRINGKIMYPSRFMLVAAMNPCRCGYYGDPVKQCSCTESDRIRYISKLSGPLLDRIDMHIAMERIVYQDISAENIGECANTAALRKKVISASKIQRERYIKHGITGNSQLTPQLIKNYCHLDESGQSIMEAAFSKWHMSARSYHRILRLSRTVADLDASENIKDFHVLEALSYRMPDKYFK